MTGEPPSEETVNRAHAVWREIYWARAETEDAIERHIKEKPVEWVNAKLRVAGKHCDTAGPPLTHLVRMPGHWDDLLPARDKLETGGLAIAFARMERDPARKRRDMDQACDALLESERILLRWLDKIRGIDRDRRAEYREILGLPSDD